MKYFDELQLAMEYLADQPDTIFIGQATKDKGTGMSNTLVNVPIEKRIEFPVMENTQLGVSTGMALNGAKVISIFPRFNFLLCAMDQLINHLDKIKTFSHNEYTPSLIIRTGVGSIIPLHPQAQHVGNFSEAFRSMCTNIEIIELNKPEEIFSSYMKAYTRNDGVSTILVEISDLLNG